MTRASVLVAAVAAGVTVVATPAVGATLQEATDAGVAFLAGRCADQQPLLAALADAIDSGDAAAARTAYVASRPPYEEIEVLATNEVLGELDGRIDARPYAFDGGEDDPDWAGFHRVERDLYRDGNLTAAAASTAALRVAVDELCVALTNNTAGVSPTESLDGQVALSFEVAAKKVSSEEETWSDASLLIYKHNYRGIWGLFAPFKEAGLAPTIAAQADAAYEALVAAYATVDPAGVAAEAVPARPYSAVPVAERAALMNATYEFAAVLRDARDALLAEASPTPAPATSRMTEGVVAPSTVRDEGYADETAAGIAAFAAQCEEQQRVLVPLRSALDAGDMPAARAAYAAGRGPYEQIETLAAAFEEEDTAIDARPDAFEYGELDPDWGGIHAVERALYRDDDASAALTALDGVDAAVASLCTKLENGSSLFSASTTWEGMLALSLEVPAKKISSEEETWSDLSVMIFRENAKGIRSLYTPFAPRLSAPVREAVNASFNAIQKLWGTIDAGNDWETGVDFRAYANVTIAERGAIHTAFMTLHRSLQRGAAEVMPAASPVPSPGASPEASPTATPAPADDGGTCFPGSATVELDSGATVAMADLSIGDRVRTACGEFSPVFLFSHADPSAVAAFVQLTTASGHTLRATASHYLPVGGRLVAAGSVTVGTRLTLAGGHTSPVTAVATVVDTGLYNPHTVDGAQLVVDGVVTSTYTTSVAPGVAAVLLAPLRAAYAVAGWSTGALSGGSPLWRLLPHGRAVVGGREL
ncbi:hypothetical protein MMPV_002603 [Pyropia vietnamensis]